MTVGQDLVVLELGGQPEGGKKLEASQKPKDPAPATQSTSSDPKPKSELGAKTSEESSKPASPPSNNQEAPPGDKASTSAAKESSPKPQAQKDGPSKGSAATPGGREERRVSLLLLFGSMTQD